MPILDLANHPADYVTVAELAEYWAVSRQQVHKRIESGSLPAIRLGSRLYRVRTQAAIEFERRASVGGRLRQQTTPTVDVRRAETLPAKIGLRRVRDPNEAS
jgi:excisionase family DNA binding protein